MLAWDIQRARAQSDAAAAAATASAPTIATLPRPALTRNATPRRAVQTAPMPSMPSDMRFAQLPEPLDLPPEGAEIGDEQLPSPSPGDQPLPPTSRSGCHRSRSHRTSVRAARPRAKPPNCLNEGEVGARTTGSRNGRRAVRPGLRAARRTQSASSRFACRRICRSWPPSAAPAAADAAAIGRPHVGLDADRLGRRRRADAGPPDVGRSRQEAIGSPPAARDEAAGSAQAAAGHAAASRRLEALRRIPHAAAAADRHHARRNRKVHQGSPRRNRARRRRTRPCSTRSNRDREVKAQGAGKDRRAGRRIQPSSATSSATRRWKSSPAG